MLEFRLARYKTPSFGSFYAYSIEEAIRTCKSCNDQQRQYITVAGVSPLVVEGRMKGSFTNHLVIWVPIKWKKN